MGYQSNADRVDFNNPVYNDYSRDGSPQQEHVPVEDMIQDRLRKEENVRHNLDPTSVIKRNDIKV